MKMLLLVLGTHPKALAAGTVKLVGSDYNLMVGEVSMLLEDSSYHGGMSKASIRTSKERLAHVL